MVVTVDLEALRMICGVHPMVKIGLKWRALYPREEACRSWKNTNAHCSTIAYLCKVLAASGHPAAKAVLPSSITYAHAPHRAHLVNNAPAVVLGWQTPTARPAIRAPPASRLQAVATEPRTPPPALIVRLANRANKNQAAAVVPKTPFVRTVSPVSVEKAKAAIRERIAFSAW